MIAVIFEVIPKPGRASRYFKLAEQLREQLECFDGFRESPRQTFYFPIF